MAILQMPIKYYLINWSKNSPLILWLQLLKMFLIPLKKHKLLNLIKWYIYRWNYYIILKMV